MPAGISRRGKRWRARAQVGGQRFVASFATRSEAESWRDRVQGEAKLRAAGIVTPAAPVAQPVGVILEALAREQEAVGRAEKTIRQTRAIARLVERALGPVAAPLTRNDLVRLIAWCRDPANTKSQGGRQIKATVGILATAHRRAGLTMPPPPRIEVHSEGRPRASVDELRRFLDAMAVGSVERTFAELVLRTGRRDSEIRRLTCGDVDLEAKTIRITRRKRAATGTPIIQVFPLHADLETLLKPYAAWRKGAPPEAPFLTLDGERFLSEFSLQKRFRATYRRAGLPERSGIAWLRNEAATLLGEAGAPVEALQRWLGHASVTTTEKHYDWSRRMEIHAVLSEALSAILKR